MTIESLLALLRHTLTFGGGALVTSGAATQGEVETGVGAIVALIGLGWSIWRKYKNEPRRV